MRSAEFPPAVFPSFQDAVEALGIGMTFRLHISADGRQFRFLQVGAGAQTLLGVSAEAILADPKVVSDLILPEDRDLIRVGKSCALAERRPCNLDIRIRREPDGDLRWCRLSSVGAPQPDGSAIWDGLIGDITESKRLAEQLAEDRRRLELALDLTGIGVFRWDRDDPECETWSEGQYRIFGVPPETPITVAYVSSLVHPDDANLLREASRTARRAPDGGDYKVEHRIVRADGEIRWVLTHGRVSRDAIGTKTIHGTTLDVTERRLAEERRRLQMRELAHRGKNAISVMMAMIQQAARNTGSAAELADGLLGRLGAMAKSQDLATASGGGPVHLADLLQQVLAPFDLARFDIDPEIETLSVAGDIATGMTLLLHELSTNAVKYGALSNGVGRIAIRRLPSAELTVLEWVERGGPDVQPPTRAGFGSRLMQAALQGEAGRVTPTYAPEGFRARLEFRAR